MSETIKTAMIYRPVLNLGPNYGECVDYYKEWTRKYFDLNSLDSVKFSSQPKAIIAGPAKIAEYYDHISVGLDSAGVIADGLGEYLEEEVGSTRPDTLRVPTFPVKLTSVMRAGGKRWPKDTHKEAIVTDCNSKQFREDRRVVTEAIEGFEIRSDKPFNWDDIAYPAMVKFVQQKRTAETPKKLRYVLDTLKESALLPDVLELGPITYSPVQYDS